jgi:hypothetical protein
VDLRGAVDVQTAGSVLVAVDVSLPAACGLQFPDTSGRVRVWVDPMEDVDPRVALPNTHPTAFLLHPGLPGTVLRNVSLEVDGVGVAFAVLCVTFTPVPAWEHRQPLPAGLLQAAGTEAGVGSGDTSVREGERLGSNLKAAPPWPGEPGRQQHPPSRGACPHTAGDVGRCHVQVGAAADPVPSPVPVPLHALGAPLRVVWVGDRVGFDGMKAALLDRFRSLPRDVVQPAFADFTGRGTHCVPDE